MDGKEIVLARLGDVVDWLDRSGVPLRRIGEVTSTTHACHLEPAPPAATRSNVDRTTFVAVGAHRRVVGGRGLS